MGYPNDRKKTRGLQWQLSSRLYAVLIGLLFIMGLVQYFNMKGYLYNNKVQTLQAKFHTIDFSVLSQLTKVNADKAALEEIADKLVDRVTPTCIIDKDGNVIYKYKNQLNEHLGDGDEKTGMKDVQERKEKEVPNVSIPELSKAEYKRIVTQGGSLERFYEIVKDDSGTIQILSWRKIGDMGNPSGIIQLSTPITDVQQILERQTFIYIGGAIFILIIATVVGTAIFRKTLTPLLNMTNTVEQIDVNELHVRLPEENKQLEIDRLSNSFNKMLERIELSFEEEQRIKERMRQFVSDASHELRTPLTSIHGFVEVLLRGAAKNEDQLEMALNTILLESDRLTKLVNDLLALSKLDQHISVEMKRENLKDVIEEIVPQLNILCENRKLNLKLDEDILVDINKNQIKQVIFNLTQNSVLHTDREKGIITISAENIANANGQYAVLKVSDNGTGIDKEHLSKIFDRFFRSDKHRSREQGGYGLGLSIVKGIVDAHSGEIDVQSEVGVGTTFSVYLKLT